MDPATLDGLLAREDDRVEWKESARDADQVLRAVSALANDLGGSGRSGFLVIGVDARGAIVGADASDEALTQLASRLSSTKILPPPSCSVHVVEREGRPLLVVEVAALAVPPVVTVGGVAWVRVGPSTRRATEADLARLQERRPEAALPFDLRAYPGANLDDLDLAALRLEHAAAMGTAGTPDEFPELERWLKQRDLVRLRSGAWVPTGAGLLVYGLDPQSLVPGAFIEFTRYAGVDVEAPVITRKTITGSLPVQLDGLWSQLTANLALVPAPAVGVRSPFVPEYPLEALKELARNLVQHRMYERTNAPSRVSWFTDRIEMINPGGPFGQANEGEFGAHSDYRNPTTTRLLVDLGYVERLGRGIQRVRAWLARNGNPPLEVATDGFTSVVVRGRA